MQKCFHELYETYSNKHLSTILLVLTHDKDISEEITQETFYQAFKNIKSFQGKMFYLYMAMYNRKKPMKSILYEKC